MVGGKTFLPVVIVSMTMNGNVAAISFATILMIVSFVFISFIVIVSLHT